MRRPCAFGAAVSITLLAAGAGAQTATGETGSVGRFQPSVAGDAMFGVPGAQIGGHLVPRAAAIVDFAYKPLSIQEGTQRYSIVSHQLFLHINASFALFDRLLISADMPFALAQGGDSPTVAGVTFNSPSGAQVGDLRLGLRARLFGDYWDPFQIAVGGYVYAPTGPKGSYAADGAVRGEPQLTISGRAPYFTYALSAGTTLHASSRPHTFDLRAGAALVLGEELVQLGPEIYVGAPFTKDVLGESNGQTITVASRAQAELLFGAKVRPVRSLVIGLGAGPGLTQGWGTPKVLAVGSIAYEPLPPRPAAADSDGDGIPDATDACPQVKGERNDDPKKNGCPPDADGDGIPDTEDACPNVPGPRSDDPKKNGCPLDSDGDGILDTEDACPAVKGVKSDDPKKNGCPPDADGDGIPDAEDKCPTQAGPRDTGGCPRVVVTPTEIVIDRQIHFRFGRSTIDQTVDPVSDDLLDEVRRAIEDHPEVELIEVQGHADNVGDPQFNQIISEARARAVRDWLVKRGIRSDKLTTKGFGMREPVSPNDSPAGRQANRRVQFLIRKRNGKD